MKIKNLCKLNKFVQFTYVGAILKFLKLLFAVIIVSDSFNDFDTYFEA